MRTVKIARIYDAPESGQGKRVLVDRVWPRGVSKSDAKLDAWLKEVAPSSQLRRWYGHQEERYAEFKRHYQAELDDAEHAEAWKELESLAHKGTITLLTASKDVDASHVPIIVERLENRDFNNVDLITAKAATLRRES